MSSTKVKFQISWDLDKYVDYVTERKSLNYLTQEQIDEVNDLRLKKLENAKITGSLNLSE